MNDDCVVLVFVVNDKFTNDQASYRFYLCFDSQIPMLSQKLDIFVKPGVEFSRIDFAFVSVGIKLKNGIELYLGPM